MGEANSKAALKTLPVAFPSAALMAASKLMRSRGHVVIGIPAHEEWETPAEGGYVVRFAGQQIGGGFVLVIDGPATRADWDEQFRALFPKGNRVNPALGLKGERFYRCSLVKFDERKF